MTHQTEEEQVEAMKQWWKDNGSALMIGVAIGLTLLFSFRGWQSYTQQQSEAASNTYEAVVQALEAGDVERAKGISTSLLSEHNTSVYAALTSLNLAAEEVKGNKLSAAHANLQWVLDQGALTELTHIARLRKAHLYMAEQKVVEAKQLIANVEVGGFKGAYAALKGDIAVAEKQNEAARAAYSEALSSTNLSAAYRNTIELKRDSLGINASDVVSAALPTLPKPEVNEEKKPIKTSVAPTSTPVAVKAEAIAAPVAAEVKPAVEAAAPVAAEVKPAVEAAAAPVAAEVKPAVEAAAAPVAAEVKPVVEAAAPVAAEVKPAVEAAAAPVVAEVKPAVEAAAAPVAAEVKPAVEAVAAPVAAEVKPAVEAAAPVAAEVKPAVEAAAPVAAEVKPAVEAAAAPVAAEVKPAVEAAAPVAAEVKPVVEAAVATPATTQE